MPTILLYRVAHLRPIYIDSTGIVRNRDAIKYLTSMRPYPDSEHRARNQVVLKSSLIADVRT